MVISLLLAGSGPFRPTQSTSPHRWEAPFTAVKQPEDYTQFDDQLDTNGTGIFIDSNRVTFLSKGKENSLGLPDWLRLPFIRDDKEDVWVAQATMKGWDKAFFTYRLKVGKKVKRPVFYAAHAPRPPKSAKTLKGTLQTIPFVSKELGESRDVTVYLPPKADGNLNAVYMADGQSCEEFARVLEPLILSKKMAPTAIIGFHSGQYKGDIAHYDMSQDFRAREYLKVADPDRFESHLRFITNEVMPWAETKFGLQADATHRALFGFSNGAAFATVASTERPDLFTAIMPFSVAAFDRGDLRKSAEGKKLPTYWLTAGTLESFIGNTQDVEKILEDDHASVHFESFVAGHDEAMWRLAFARDLPHIFPYQK